MKQLLSLITCSILAITGLQTHAQITILSTDLTSIGDVIVRHTDTVPTYGPGNAGPNQTWDFSDAINDTIVTTTVVTLGVTGFASTFSSSDYAMTTGTDSYLFFEHNANSMTTTGAAGDLLATGEQIESPFSDPLLLHEFPRTYESNYDDTYAFVTEADGAGLDLPIPVYRVRLTHSGHVYDTTDAYGTLITPTGSYDALRVKTVDYTTDHLEYKLLSFSPWATFSNTSATSVSYAWHAKEEMLAIAEYAYDSIGNPARFTYSTVPPVNTVSVEETFSNSINLYPQPTTGLLCVSGLNAGENNQFEVYSTAGKLISNGELNSKCIQFEGLNCGIYILRIKSQDTYHKSLKFIIRKE
jgi:hypothetical protein